MKRALKILFFKKKKESFQEDTLKFILLFSVFSAIAFLLINFFSFFNWIAAYSTQPLLSLLGIASTISFSSSLGFPLIESKNFVAVINDLCTGKIELAVLAGIVLASRDRSLKERLKGVFLGFLFVFLFNPVRIAVTLFFYNPSAFFFYSFLHELFFRISLILFIVGYYALWYFVLSQENK